MILYHGSYIEVSKPDLLHSRQTVDFGAGFYTTPVYEQAERWCGKFKRRGKKGIVSIYTFDEKALEELNRLRYEKPNMQICFRTQSALDYLKYERCEEI